MRNKNMGDDALESVRKFGCICGADGLPRAVYFLIMGNLLHGILAHNATGSIRVRALRRGGKMKFEKICYLEPSPNVDASGLRFVKIMS